MPVTKKTGTVDTKVSTDTTTAPKTDCCSSQGWGHCAPHHAMNHHNRFARKLILTFFGILLVYLIVFIGVKIRNEIKAFEYIGVADKSDYLITVDAQGEVDVTPNIATVQMGLTTEAPTVAEAQAKNTETVNVFITRVKGLGIVSEDIQSSNYDVYPKYDWTQAERQELVGYEVSQNVHIKIRNLELSKQVVALAGETGITNVGNLEYTVDEKDAYLAEAREKALEKVADKAAILSKSLGVRMKQVVGYNEYETGNEDNYYKMSSLANEAATQVAPDLQPGTNKVTLYVSVTFEI